MKPIRINKALGRQAKIFFIDVEHMPAVIISAILAFFISQFFASGDWLLPLLIFVGLFGAWMVTVRKNPKQFIASFYRNHPPRWRRGAVYYAHPLHKSKSR